MFINEDYSRSNGSNIIDIDWLNITYFSHDNLAAEISCWIYSSERQLVHMRLEYLRSVLRQEVGAFDTDLTTAHIITGVTNHMSVIQDAIGEKVMDLTTLTVRFLKFRGQTCT